MKDFLSEEVFKAIEEKRTVVITLNGGESIVGRILSSSFTSLQIHKDDGSNQTIQLGEVLNFQ